MAELQMEAGSREPDRDAMAPLNSERERALRFLAEGAEWLHRGADVGARLHLRTVGLSSSQSSGSRNFLRIARR
jgi:hypothetical protein